MKLTIAISCLVLSSGERTAPHPMAIDIQGVWETKLRVADKPIRIVATMRDDVQTVEYFRDGKLLQKHAVKFQIRDEGPVTVFRWSGGKQLAGPRKGQPVADGVAVVRLVDGKWITAEGFLSGSPKKPLLLTYQRVADRQ